MKKLFLLLTAILPLFVFTECSDDDNVSPAQSVLVNVTYDGTLASPTLVQLYDYEEASKCKFDYDAMCEYGDYRNLIDESGNEIRPKYTSDSTAGVNTFEEVENGEYMLVVMYKPEGYSWPMFYFYAYKEIKVNPDTNAKLYSIEFTDEDRGKFVGL